MGDNEGNIQLFALCSPISPIHYWAITENRISPRLILLAEEGDKGSPAIQVSHGGAC